MPGGAAAVVPRMPLRAVGPVAAAVLRIPGKGTKIFFAGKIRSRFSAGAGARTRPFPPDMPEPCRLRVAPGRSIARRSSGPPRLRSHARRPTPDARRGIEQRGPALSRIPALLCCPFWGRSPCPGRCGRMLFLRFAGENASFWESLEILLPLPRILNRNNNGISITQR